jgi:hypothetical protein
VTQAERETEAEERWREININKRGGNNGIITTTDMGPREFTNRMRDSEEERSKENSKDSRIMVKLGGKDQFSRFQNHIVDVDGRQLI